MLSKKFMFLNRKKLIGSFKMKKTQRSGKFNEKTRKMGRGVLQSHKVYIL